MGITLHITIQTDYILQYKRLTEVILFFSPILFHGRVFSSSVDEYLKQYSEQRRHVGELKTLGCGQRYIK